MKTKKNKIKTPQPNKPNELRKHLKALIAKGYSRKDIMREWSKTVLEVFPETCDRCKKHVLQWRDNSCQCHKEQKKTVVSPIANEAISYKDLAEKLNKFPEEQKNKKAIFREENFGVSYGHMIGSVSFKKNAEEEHPILLSLNLNKSLRKS